VLGAVDHAPRHDAVLQRAALGIDVAQEQVERSDALLQATLDLFPFRRGDDARQHVGRDDALGRRRTAWGIVVDGEGDSLLEERKFAGLLAAGEFLRGKRG